MTSWDSLLAVLGPVLGWLACVVLAAGFRLAGWWRFRRARRRVLVAAERAAAQHVRGLVPGQRGPSDLPPWADLVDQQDGDSR